MAGAEGLAVCFALLWLADRCRATVPGSPLVAKNSPPDCFLNAQTLSGSSPYQKKSRTSATLSFWQGQKDLNPRHAVLEISIHSLFIAVYRLLGGTMGAHIVFYKKNVLLKPLIPYTFFCIFYTYNLLCVHHKIKQNFCKSSAK